MSTTTGLPPGSNAIINSAYPIPSTPFVDPKTGIITTIWWRFLISLLARTGGPVGVVTTDVELLTGLQNLTDTDAPVDTDELVLALYNNSDDLLSALGDDNALGLAIQSTGPDETAQDLFPTFNDDPPAIIDGWTWQTEAATNVAAGTYTLMGWAPFAGAITALRAVVGPAAIGTLTETVSINGTPVTGMNAVAVNAAAAQSFLATGASRFIQGDRIQLVVAIAAGVPVGAWSTVQYTRIPQ